MKVILAVFAAIVILGTGAYVVMNSKSNKPDYVTSTPSKSSKPASPNGSAGSAATPGTGTSVEISNFVFSPADVTVKKGTAVTWTNKDSSAHTVSANDSQGGPQSPQLNKGQTYSFTYTKAGTFKYHCSIHPHMTGSVTVTE